MAWQTPKTDWGAADVPLPDDFNRIEGNVQELQDTKETPAGAQAKANAALNSAKQYTDQEVAEVSQALDAHKAESATTSAKGHVQLSDSVTSTSTTLAATANAVKKAYDRANEAFQSASDGKNLIATAITGKGIPASGSDTFSQLANKIKQIEVGDYKVGDILNLSKYLIAPEIWKFTGHTSYVEAVAVDNNGNVYSGGRDDTVRKISSSGNEIWKFTGHTDYVYAVAVDNNGNVYSGSDDKTVRKISSSGNEIWKFTGHTSYVNAVAVDNNGNVYSGSSDKTVRKISSSGNEVWSFTGHTNWVQSVAVDNNGYVYSGGYDDTVRKILDGIKIIA